MSHKENSDIRVEFDLINVQRDFLVDPLPFVSYYITPFGYEPRIDTHSWKRSVLGSTLSCVPFHLISSPGISTTTSPRTKHEERQTTTTSTTTATILMYSPRKTESSYTIFTTPLTYPIPSPLSYTHDTYLLQATTEKENKKKTKTKTRTTATITNIIGTNSS